MGNRDKPRSGVRRWRQWSEEEGRAAVAEHASSGLTAAAFTRSRGISKSRLAYWKEHVEDARGVPMTLVAVPVPADTGAHGAHIEITPEGMLHVREDLDVEHLARIVGALARRARGC